MASKSSLVRAARSANDAVERARQHVRTTTVVRQGHAVCIARVQKRDGTWLTFKAVVPVESVRALLRSGSDVEVGWFGSSLVRKGKGLVKKTAKRAVKVAKSIAKSKALKAIWKTAPIWANIVPPPAGQAIATGAAVAQAAMKVADAAKKGNKVAKEFVSAVKKDRRAAKQRVVKLARDARFKALPKAKQRKALYAAANGPRTYMVINPLGKRLRVKI